MQHPRSADSNFHEWQHGAERHDAIIDHRTLKHLGHENRSHDDEPDQHLVEAIAAGGLSAPICRLANQQPATFFTRHHRVFGHFADPINRHG